MLRFTITKQLNDVFNLALSRSLIVNTYNKPIYFFLSLSSLASLFLDKEHVVTNIC